MPMATQVARHPYRMTSSDTVGAHTNPPMPAPTASSENARDRFRTNQLASAANAGMYSIALMPIDTRMLYAR